MAKKNHTVLKKPGRKKKPRALAKSYDQSVLGGEPTWADNVDHSKVDIIRALNWYNYFVEGKASNKMLFTHYQGDAVKLKALKVLRDIEIPALLGHMSRMISLGCKFQPSSLEHYNDLFEKTYTRATAPGRMPEEEETNAPNAPKVIKLTVQQRTALKLNSKLGEIEGIIDDFIINHYKGTFDLYKWLQAQEIKPNQCKDVAAAFTPMMMELSEALVNRKDKSDDQLTEAYKHINTAQLKRFVAFIDNIITDIERWRTNGKVIRKPRKKKVVTIDKKLGKFQYLDHFNEMKIVSIDPKKIIGASQLWVYNTKYKKLYHYIAADRGGFDINNTTLVNYSADSVVKRVRKPEEAIHVVLNATKNILKKFMGTLTTKPGNINGRINKECILLKVMK